jgi:predicted XRE-type DNA-binding protein
VFADMGLENAAELELKADLIRQINAGLEARHLTQAQATGLLGLHQPEVSLLRRGRLCAFGIERLIRCLGALDMEVELRVLPKRPVSAGVRSRELGKAAKRRKARPRRVPQGTEEFIFA